MASKTFLFKNAAASGASHGSLQDGGTLTTATMGTGWTVAKTAPTVYSLGVFNTVNAAGTFSGTALPNAAPSTSDCFRSENKLYGVFDAGTWSIAVAVISVTTAATGAGRIRFRIWKSSNATGTGATELTSGAVQTNQWSNVTTSTAQNLTVTTGSLASATFAGEYLFVQFACEIDTASGSTSANVRLRVDATNSKVTTANFTPNKQWWISDASPSGFTGATLTETAPGSPTGFNTAWNVGTSTGYSLMVYNNSAIAGFGGTALPNAAPVGTDGFRTSTTYALNFQAGNWILGLDLSAFLQGGATVKVEFRLWKSLNADGSGATELTSGIQEGNQLVLDSSDQQSFISVSLGAFALNNEYLILQVALRSTVAGTAGNDANIVTVPADVNVIAPPTSPAVAEEDDIHHLLVPSTPATMLLAPQYRNDDEASFTPATPLVDDEYWINEVKPVQATQYLSPLVIDREGEAPAGNLLVGPPEDEFGKLPITAPPAPIVMLQVRVLEEELPVAAATAALEEDLARAPLAWQPPPTMSRPPADDEAPAGALFGQPEEQDWFNQVRPIPATLYLDPVRRDLEEEQPAGNLFGQPEEQDWFNQVKPVQPVLFQRLPVGDRDDDPAGVLFGQPEEQDWFNQVRPIPATQWQRLPVGERDEEPAGALFGQPDDEYWINQVKPVPLGMWQRPPTGDRDEEPAGALYGQAEETDRPVQVPPQPSPAPRRVLELLEDLPVVVAGSLAAEEELGRPPAPWASPAARPLPRDTEEVAAAPAIAAEEDRAAIALVQQPAAPVRLQLEAADELPILAVEEDVARTISPAAAQVFARLVLVDEGEPAELAIEEDQAVLFRPRLEQPVPRLVQLEEELAAPVVPSLVEEEGTWWKAPTPASSPWVLPRFYEDDAPRSNRFKFIRGFVSEQLVTAVDAGDAIGQVMLAGLAAEIIARTVTADELVIAIAGSATDQAVTTAQTTDEGTNE